MKTKSKISVSMDEQLVRIIEVIVAEGEFRNKSHFIEYATKQLILRRHQQ